MTNSGVHSSAGVKAGGHFPTTQWSAVLEAGSGVRAMAAVDELCRAYWLPLYAYLRRSGVGAHDAEDLVQGFLARLIQREDLATVGPEKGRFRTYLLTALRHYLLKDLERKRALKRGGHPESIGWVRPVPDPESAIDLAAPSPEVAFDRRWARTVLERALARLRDEQEARGRVGIFDAMAPYLDGAETSAYEAVAAQWGVSPGNFAVRVHRLRLRLRELVRVEVASTVQNPADVVAEMRHLFEVWQE